MSILEKFRSGQDSTFMQLVMVVIILSFIGFMGRSRGDKGGNVAVVNGVPISDIEFNRAYRSEARRREVERGTPLSDGESGQLVEVVRSRLVEDEVLTQEAQRLGIEVSDAEVARIVFSEPAFKGPDGRFNEEQYLKRIAQDGSTQDQFEQRIRDRLQRYKLQQLVFLGASTSDSALREAWIEAGTTVDLQVVRIRPTQLTKLLEITDEVRAEWKKENAAAIQEAYDRDKARLYDHPETVRLRLVKLATTPGGPDLAPRLEQVRARVAAGEDMEALARRWSEDASALKGGDLGAKPVGQLPADLSAAVANLQPGEVSPVFTTATDVRFVRVEERTPAKVDTLEEVEPQIVDRLIREEKLPALALDFAEQKLLAKWKETGAVPQELLDEQGLSARPTGPVRLTDPGPMGPPRALLDAARAAPVGSVLPRVFEEGGTLNVAQLSARVEPDPAEFETDKDRLREELLLGQRSEFYTAWVADRKAHAKIEMVGGAAR